MVDSILRGNLVEKAAEAGLRSLFVGFETFSPKNLRQSNKKQNLKKGWCSTKIGNSRKANSFVQRGYLSIQTPIFHKNIRLATIPYFTRTPPNFYLVKIIDLFVFPIVCGRHFTK